MSKISEKGIWHPKAGIWHPGMGNPGTCAMRASLRGARLFPNGCPGYHRAVHRAHTPHRADLAARTDVKNVLTRLEWLLWQMHVYILPGVQKYRFFTHFIPFPGPKETRPGRPNTRKWLKMANFD